MAEALTLAEARELVAASVAHLAQRLAIPVLLIKGPTLAAHGLREPRDSADVDLLASPARVGALVAALVERGWHEYAQDTTAHVMAPASVTLVHQAWPLELDLHHSFPGFLTDPQTVFDSLWARREEFAQAAQPLAMPDRLGSILVAALHYERTPQMHQTSLDDLARRAGADLDIQGLAELAAATGCADTLRSFLDGLGVPPVGVGNSDPDALAAWELFRSGGWVPGVAWLEALRRAPWRKRPAILWHAVMFTEDELRLRYPAAPAGARGVWLARWWRIRQALMAMPRALRVLRDQRP